MYEIAPTVDVREYPFLLQPLIQEVLDAGDVITGCYFDPTGGYAGEGYGSISVLRPDASRMRVSGSGIVVSGRFQFLVRLMDELDAAGEFVRLAQVQEG